MAAERILELRDVGELRQVLATRPPAIVHGTIVLLVLGIAAAVTWGMITEANVVVRGPARVRPADAPLRGFDEVASEHVHAEVGGRVAALRVREGQTVHRGEALVVLDTTRIDHELARLDAELGAARLEVEALDDMRRALDEQLAAAQHRGEAELARSARAVGQAGRRASSDSRIARVELDDAQRELARASELAAQGAGPEADVSAAAARVARARERVAASAIGFDDGEPEVLRRSLAQARRDHGVKLVDLRRQRAVKQGEIAAGEQRRAGLALEREHATLTAHRSGIVALGGLAVGDVIAAGKLPVAIVEQGKLRVDAAIDTGHVADVRPGMPVRIKIDALEHQRYGTATGTIAHVAADAVAPARGGPPYYLVSVELDRDSIGTGADARELKAGMSGELEVITERAPLLALFFDRIRGALSL